MSITPISAVSSASFSMPAEVTSAVSGVEGSDAAFASQLTSAVDGIQGLQAMSSELAVRALTGDLSDVHDYTIAATEAAVALELASALRNKMVDAVTEVLRITV
ncbi:flagellar hook-basal body complex protein FliE [Demequina subtropica]|uniref:flagellar hook-basal body complex protein FliE n=1 Tax=Demequina subtropica TaxID=1638989 RepID=UPI0009E4CD72|nr:flagellar hook-basal body complex protein FliE [Demequina subtropica]